MIPIVFSTDHNYVMPARVTISSLLISGAAESYDIYILIGEDVTETDQNDLRNTVKCLSRQSRIQFIDMGKMFDGGYETRGISKACYYRLMIPWLLPDIDKIIYSDVDVIFKTSMKEVFETDITGHYVAGGLPNFKDGWKSMEKYFNKIGIDYHTYINSGILLINSKLQREDKLNLIYQEESKRKYIYQDQDIINIVCRGKITHFDRRYNLMPSLYGTQDNLIDNLVLHYAGDKPWVDFTYAWVEWWNVYLNSNFCDMEFYHSVCSKIQNPKRQLFTITKKVREKIQQNLKKMGR